jgi:membrane protein required for colicin V production
VKGFAWQLASIASIVVSYMVAYKFREPFSQSIQAEAPWNRFLAMLILYIGTALVIWVAFRMVSGSIDRLKLKEFDHQMGALFGLAKGALYCSLITLFAVTLMGETIRQHVVKSRSGHFLATVLDRSQAVIPAEIHEVVQPYLDRIDQRLQQGETDSSFNRMPWLAGAEESNSGSNIVPANLQNWVDENARGQLPAAPTNGGQWPQQQAQGQQWGTGLQR